MGNKWRRALFILLALLAGSIILINLSYIGINILNKSKISNGLGLEENLLIQKQQTYDSFLLTITFFGAGFMILLTVLLAGGLIYNVYQINLIKEDVEERLKKHFGGETKKIIDEIMKRRGFEKKLSNQENELNALKSYISRLTLAIQKKVPIPEYKEKEELNEKTKNIFD